ncbi:MAG TPA: ABC transporter substrate-binding protein [Opitutaceae bacterium]
MAHPDMAAPLALATPRCRSPDHLVRRALRVLTLLAAFLTLLARSQADEVSADGKVHVTYWEKWVGFEADALHRVIDRFNRSQDRIVVTAFSTSSIDRKTIVATAGGDPPDIAGLWIQNIAQYAEAEALTPLDEFLRTDGLSPAQWLARYQPAYARLCTHQGRVYAAISTPNLITFHWNKTLFREAGLDPERPPRTLEELREYHHRLTRRDPKTGEFTRLGFLPEEPGWWPWIFYPWFGGVLFDGENITLGADPRNFAAMRWVADWTRELGVERVQRFKSAFAGQQASSEAAFFSGKVAITIHGVYYNNYIRQYKPGLDYGVGPWPEAAPGVTDFAMVEADMLVIPRGAKNPRAAWEFIKYLNSYNPRARSLDELEGAELLCYLHQKHSPLRDWSPFFTEHHPHPHIAMFRELSASPHAVSAPATGIWREYDRELVALFERVRLLVDTPENSIRYAHERLTKSWQRYRRSLERHGQLGSGDAAPTP